MQRVWVIIISIAVVLFSILGYLGLKYYQITKGSIANVSSPPTPEPIIPKPDPFEEVTVGVFVGEVSCIEIIQLEKGEECKLGFITEGGNKLLLSSGIPDFINQIKRGDKLSIQGVVSSPNPMVDKSDYSFLIVRDFTKL